MQITEVMALFGQMMMEKQLSFTESEKKNNGDIILIKVAGKLKNEITAELKESIS